MILITGLVLSMAVDPHENWVALGTSLGYHVVWDMRFQLPIRHWQHTGHQKCMSHPLSLYTTFSLLYYIYIHVRSLEY